jgi:predicted nicotinamide N-methyase
MVTELFWGAELPPEAAAPFDIVLCSELIYDANGHLPLIECLLAVTQPGTVILFSYKYRGLGETAFATMLHADTNYRVKKIPKGMLDPEFADEDQITVLRAIRL